MPVPITEILPLPISDRVSIIGAMMLQAHSIKPKLFTFLSDTAWSGKELYFSTINVYRPLENIQVNCLKRLSVFDTEENFFVEFDNEENFFVKSEIDLKCQS